MPTLNFVVLFIFRMGNATRHQRVNIASGFFERTDFQWNTNSKTDQRHLLFPSFIGGCEFHYRKPNSMHPGESSRISKKYFEYNEFLGDPN